MRTTVGYIGRALATALIFGWWSLGVILVFGSGGEFEPAALVYIVPLEIVGGVMAWKATDPDRSF